MPTQQTVTAGIDGSPESLDAAGWAAREALRRDLPLHVVHACDPAAERRRPPEVDVPFHREDGTLGRAVLQLSRAYPALRILDEEVAGSPAGALLAAARSSALLVVGSHGAGALTRVMIGSVAQAVAARASCPVALVQSGEDHSRDEHQGPTNGRDRPVVLGLDLDRPGDELLEYAFGAAASRRAPLHVVHVWTAPLIPSADAIDPMPEKERLLAAELASWRHKFPGTQVTETLVHGLAGRSLLEAASAADLLVIGRRIPTGPHLGQTAHSAIHHARCPVVVVPHY